MRNRFVFILALAALPLAASAQSTAFTYQGRLNNGAALASGLHDLRFKLFDAATGGTQFGATLCVDNVQVTDGLFTTAIDFGQQFASVNSRFLEIEVRPDTGQDCSNSAGFTTLTPRSPLTATPLASHAKAAYSLDSPNGSHPSALMVDNSGRVGIGTAAPTHIMHIAAPEPTLALQDTDSSTAQVGYISYRDVNNTERAWVGYGTPGSAEFSVVNARTSGNLAFSATGLLRFIANGSERMTITPAGSVGIGTTGPTAALEVRGDIRLGSSGQFKAVAGEENLRTIRGRLGTVGQRLLGSGYSGSYNTSTRIYTITYDTPFTSAPVVVLTPEQGNDSADICAQICNFTSQAGSVQVAIFLRSDGSYVQRPFDFIAIGPR